jgi:hypothetical protein
MSSLTEASCKMMLDWLCRGALPVQPGGCWIGLATGVPNSRYGSELSASNYIRRTVSFAAASAGTASNQNALRWGPFGSWATVLGLQLWDASSGGTMLWQGPLLVARTMVPNDTFDIAIGGLTCGLN